MSRKLALAPPSKGWRLRAIFPCLDLLASLPAGCRPKIIALENVTGLFGKRSREFFDAICDRLTAMGYRCGAVVVHAANFTPQSRERVFIVAVDEALDIPASIIADRPSSPFHTKPLVEALRRQPTLQPIWWRLPVPPPREAMLADILEEDPRVPWDAKAVTDRIIAKWRRGISPSLTTPNAPAGGWSAAFFSAAAPTARATLRFRAGKFATTISPGALGRGRRVIHPADSDH